MFYYSVNGGSWSTDVPQASEAGTYTIRYYIKGNGDYKDNGSESEPLGTLTVIVAAPAPGPDPDPAREPMSFFMIGSKQELPRTGFSALHPQVLPKQPKDLRYGVSGMTLVIPSLDVSSEIVDVPFRDDEYDVTWLGSSVGMLEGSSLPGEGISLITGHNHLNTTAAGPFAFLKGMEENERIFVLDKRDNLQIFEVFANVKIAETDFDGLESIAAMNENSLVLITCEDEGVDGGYANRRIIAAKPL